jgi:hypothetical protein
LLQQPSTVALFSPSPPFFHPIDLDSSPTRFSDLKSAGQTPNRQHAQR